MLPPTSGTAMPWRESHTVGTSSDSVAFGFGDAGVAHKTVGKRLKTWIMELL